MARKRTTTIGGRVRSRREKLNLTQRELARRSNKDFITIWRIEHGAIAQPQLETLRSLADALDCTLAWLAFGQAA